MIEVSPMNCKKVDAVGQRRHKLHPPDGVLRLEKDPSSRRRPLGRLIWGPLVATAFSRSKWSIIGNGEQDLRMEKVP